MQVWNDGVVPGKAQSAVVRLFVSIAAVVVPTTVAAPARAAETLDVRGEVVLASRADWRRGATRTCAGEGLYRDLRRGIQVRVLKDRGPPTVLATSRIRVGHARDGYCEFRFRLRQVRSSARYRFEIRGTDGGGLIFTDTRDLTDIERDGGEVRFVIGAPEQLRPGGM
jgi:hypothetical protein